MLEHQFWENFRKWVPHPEVDEVYDVEEIGFQEDGFAVLLRPDHFQEEKRSEWALRLVWDRIVSYTVTDESYRPELWVSEKTPGWALWTFYLSETSDQVPGGKLHCYRRHPPLFYLRDESDGRHFA